MIQKIAMITSVLLPLSNIPLIIKMIRRKSSQDVSVVWAVGVWAGFGLMLPAGLMSTDMIWKTFNIMNFILFSGVALTVVIYRNGPKS